MIGINELIEMWTHAGGTFHGPNVETGTIPERALISLLTALIGTQSGTEVWRRVEEEFGPRAWAAVPAAVPPTRPAKQRARLPVPAPAAQEEIGKLEIETALVIKVEKMLCRKLGREWTATGISIESLVDELAARTGATVPAAIKLNPQAAWPFPQGSKPRST